MSVPNAPPGEGNMTRARKIIIAVVVVLAIVVAGAICLSTFTMSGVAGSAWPEMEAGAPPPRAAPADSTATDTNAMETVKQCPDGSIVPPTMQCPGATTPLPPAADGASDNAVAPAPSPSVRQGLGAFVDPG